MSVSEKRQGAVGRSVKGQRFGSAALLTAGVVSGLWLAPGLTPAAHAVDRDWVGVGGLLFYDTAGNWNPAATPAAGDNLTFAIDVAGNPIIIGASSAAQGIDITDNDWEFTGAAGGVLTSGGANTTIDDILGTTLANGTNLLVSNDLTWNNANDLVVGNLGYGSLTIEGDSNLAADEVFVGRENGSVGEITVTGANTSLTATRNLNTGIFIIGNDGGTGTINVLAGADLRTTSTSGNDIWVGSGAFDADPGDPNNPLVPSVGTLNVDGVGSFAETEDLQIGIFGGTGFLNVTNGGQVVNTDGGTNGSPDTIFANDAGSIGHGLVDGDDSLLRSRRFDVGFDGTATLVVSNGGEARSLTQGTSVGDFVIATNADSTGEVAVYGTATDGTTASLLDVDQSLFVGNVGFGSLRVGQQLDGTADGAGALQVDVDLRIADNATNAEANRVVIDGANATANVDNVTYVGFNGTGDNRLEVTGGAQFTGRFLRVGHSAGANGTLLIDGAGSTLDTDADATNVTDDTVIGTNGTGVATVSNGGTLRTDEFWVGYQGNADGTLIVDGGTVLAGVDNNSTGSNVDIGGRDDGSGGTGGVTIQNGGVMRSAVQTVIGGNSTSTGSLTVTGVGSLFDNFDNGPGGASNDILRIGQNGNGTAEVLDGGRIEAEGILIGHVSTNSAIDADLVVSGVNNTGGTLTPSTVWTGGYLYVGNSREASLTVEAGGQVSIANSIQTERLFIADDNAADGSRLLITGPGSRVDYNGTGDVSVGNAGGSVSNRAVLEVRDGGVFSTIDTDNGDNSQARIIVGDLDGGNGHVIVDGVGSLVEASVMFVGDGNTNSTGLLDITNGGVVDLTGEFQGGSNGNGDGTITVDGSGSALNVGTTLTLGDDVPGNGNATGILDVIDGGGVTSGGSGFIGRSSGSVGVANVGGPGAQATWEITDWLYIAGSANLALSGSQTSGGGTLNLDINGLVDVAGQTVIKDLGTVNLDGGELATGTLLFQDFAERTGVPTLNFNSGTLRFTQSGDNTLDAALLTNIFNNGPQTLTTGQHLAVNKTAVLGGPVRVNGGELSLGSINATNFQDNVDFDAGTFNLTDSSLFVTGVGLFGSTLTVNEDQAVNVSNSLVVQPDGLLNVSRGSVSAAAGVNTGTAVIAEGTATFTNGFINNGDLIVIDATLNGALTNNGDLTVVGTSSIGSLALGSGGGIDFEIATLTGTPDLLNVAGAVTVDGGLTVTADDPNALTLGSEFDLINAGSVSGSFSALSLPTLTGGLGFDVLYEANRVALAVVNLSVILGDYNDSGQVEQGDLDLVLQNWGVDTDANGIPAGWTNDLPSGQIEQTELDGVLQNWGNTSAPDFSGSSVPEPATLGSVAAVALLIRRRRHG